MERTVTIGGRWDLREPRLLIAKAIVAPGIAACLRASRALTTAISLWYIRAADGQHEWHRHEPRWPALDAAARHADGQRRPRHEHPPRVAGCAVDARVHRDRGDPCAS